jgi:hypothetical protein
VAAAAARGEDRREEAAAGADDGERHRVLPDREDGGEHRDRREQEEGAPGRQEVPEPQRAEGREVEDRHAGALQSERVAATALAQPPADDEQRDAAGRHRARAAPPEACVVRGVLEQEGEADEEDQQADSRDGVAAGEPRHEGFGSAGGGGRGARGGGGRRLCAGAMTGSATGGVMARRLRGNGAVSTASVIGTRRRGAASCASAAPRAARASARAPSASRAARRRAAAAEQGLCAT